MPSGRPKGGKNNYHPKEEKQIKFEIVETLSKEFNVRALCRVMNISRSGYYKWLKTN